MRTRGRNYHSFTNLLSAAGALLHVVLLSQASGQRFENLDTGLVKVPTDAAAEGDRLQGTVDLTQTFRELNQGNAVAPLFLLHSLENERGRSALDLLGRYGFMADGGPRPGVASGFTLAKKSLPLIKWDVSTSGFSCTACHSGELQYGGKRYRVDGMPGLVDIEGWTLELARIVDQNKPTTVKGGRRFMGTIKRAVRYSFEWRVKDDQKTDALIPSFEMADLENFEKSMDDLMARSSGPVLAEGDGGEKAEVPYSRQVLSANQVMRGYQLSVLTGIYGEETEATSGLDFLEEETKDFMRKRSNVPRSEKLFQREKAMYGYIRKMSRKIRREYDVLSSRYSNGRSLITALQTHPSPGYGRDDAWGLIDRFVGGGEQTVLSRPISIPPLFGCGDYLVFHCDGNTNSMMDRNIAQAVALGAGVDKKGSADLSLRKVNHANQLAAKLVGPVWPAFFPALEPGTVAAGKKLFEEKKYEKYQVWDYLGRSLPAERVSCADCHSTPGKISDQRYYNVGTSQIRLNHYPEQPGMLKKVSKELERIRAATRKHPLNTDISDLEARTWERDDVVWWREQKGYVARALEGIWASSPYLHNGSVPTLRDLFLPVSERPVEFHVGSNEFDPAKVGFVSKKTAVSYRFDASTSNKGHEFGTELCPAEKDVLLEYLKTFSGGSRGGTPEGQ